MKVESILFRFAWQVSLCQPSATLPSTAISGYLQLPVKKGKQSAPWAATSEKQNLGNEAEQLWLKSSWYSTASYGPVLLHHHKSVHNSSGHICCLCRIASALYTILSVFLQFTFLKRNWNKLSIAAWRMNALHAHSEKALFIQGCLLLRMLSNRKLTFRSA